MKIIDKMRLDFLEKLNVSRDGLRIGTMGHAIIALGPYRDSDPRTIHRAVDSLIRAEKKRARRD